MTHPTNPYVAGAAVRGERGFFGRRDILRWVERELRNATTSALVLFGPRRIGKTSLLLQLRRVLPCERFLAVYFDLQDQAARPLAQVLADLADTASEMAGLPPPDPDAFDDAGRFFCRGFLPRLYQAVGAERRPVFLLDEFDALERGEDEGLPETAAARALFPTLRRLMAEDPRPAFVFVVGRQAADLTLDFTATFKTALVKEVWVLDQESARALVLQAEDNGTLRFTNQAVGRILSLSGQHPYLTQLLCQRIWERAYAEEPSAPPKVGVRDVEAAVPDTLMAGDQALAWLWDGLSPAEKIYAAALSELVGEGEAAPQERVVQMLAARAARLHTRDVEQAPRDLIKRRVLDAAGAQEHCFALELFRRWVRENRPLQRVKDEADRIAPVADRLYEVGMDFFRRQKWEAAARYFRDALEAYPRHFRARLHLGEALLELGQTEAALAELREAHALDPEEARFVLARAAAQTGGGWDASPLLIDDNQNRVYLSGREVALSQFEYLVLRILGQHVGQVVSKEALMAALRAEGEYSQASVEAAVYRIRKKLGDDGRSPRYLETRRGQGYVLRQAAYVPRMG